jgi:hypothetical protein
MTGFQKKCVKSGRSGGIAQLGERLHGMQEVSGSIPLTSTNTVSDRFVQGFDPIV